jgi:hypothetical protein
MFDRRNETREDCRVPLELTRLDAEEPSIFHGVLQNISNSGAYVVCLQSLPYGARLEFTHAGRTIRANVRYCVRAFHKQFALGLRFDEKLVPESFGGQMIDAELRRLASTPSTVNLSHEIR